MADPKTLKITSPEALDAGIADVVRWKIEHTQARAKADAEIAAVEKKHQPAIMQLLDKIAAGETVIKDYCDARRADLFYDRKSRETSLAVFGYEFTPYRVETSSRKLTWKLVVERLSRLPWGSVYVRHPAPQPDKNALLADREKLKPDQLTAAGVSFERDETFFIRPKPETAADSPNL